MGLGPDRRRLLAVRQCPDRQSRSCSPTRSLLATTTRRCVYPAPRSRSRTRPRHETRCSTCRFASCPCGGRPETGPGMWCPGPATTVFGGGVQAPFPPATADRLLFKKTRSYLADHVPGHNQQRRAGQLERLLQEPRVGLGGCWAAVSRVGRLIDGCGQRQGWGSGSSGRL